MNKDIRRGNPNEKLSFGRTKNVLKRLSKYVLKYWYLFFVAIIFTLLSNQLSLLGPYYSGSAIDAIADVGGVDFALVKSNVIFSNFVGPAILNCFDLPSTILAPVAP